MPKLNAGGTAWEPYPWDTGDSGGGGGTVDPNTAIWTDSSGTAIYKPDGVTAVAVGSYLGEYLFANAPDPTTVDPYSRFFATDDGLWCEFQVNAAGTAWAPVARSAPPLKYTSERPYLCSFGDSINSQDVPIAGEGGHSGIAPTFWANALTCCAFDYMMFNTTLVASGGSQTTSQAFTNGMSGLSGGLVTDRGKYAIDNFLTTILANAGGRPFAVLLIGGINDLSNNDTTGYDATIWAELLTIIQKVNDAGGLAIVKINEPTANLNTMKKRRNRAALSDTILTYAGGRADIAVADIEGAWRKYGLGVTWERATRGSTGDEVHPNLIGAIIHGFAIRDALKGFVRFTPPWARSDFADTLLGSTYLMSGTAGTEGTGADTAGEVPTGWTSNTYGTNTSIRCDQEVGPEGYGSRIVAVATGTPTSDQFGLNQSSNPAPTAGDTIRSFVDVDIVKADYVTQARYTMRVTGSTYHNVGLAGSNDIRAMTAASGTTPLVPSGAKLLEGNRLVMSSMPFPQPASPNGTMYSVGGGADLTNTAARWESFVRFAGYIKY